MTIDIPNYIIEKELGKGGMATVYLARHTLLGRLVALKVMNSEFAQGEAFRKAFLEEGKIIAQLEHPNIVKIYDIGVINNSVFYMAMEYLAGGSLRDLLNKEKITLNHALEVLENISEGLMYAHVQGYIHRDIKPENILFRHNKKAVITDFGLAKLQDSTSELTRMGYLAGTARYMSPEQAISGKLDDRSDQYSLALVVFEILTGDKICAADSLVQAIYQHTNVPPPHLPEQYSKLQACLNKALAKSSYDRYGSISDFVKDFKRIALNIENESSSNIPLTGKKTLTNSENDDNTVIFNHIETNQLKANGKSDLDFSKGKILLNNQLFIMVGVVVGILIGISSWLMMSEVFFNKDNFQKTVVSLKDSKQDKPSTTNSTTSTVPINNHATVLNDKNAVAIEKKGNKNKIFYAIDALNLRSKPALESENIIRKLPKNTKILILDDISYVTRGSDRSVTWFYVSALGYKGYVSEAYLSETMLPIKNEENPSSISYVVRNDHAKLYKLPNKESSSEPIAMDTVLSINIIKKKIDDVSDPYNDEWYEVSVGDSKKGYIEEYDVFPLLRHNPDKSAAERFKFEVGTDQGTLSIKKNDRRKVYVLAANQNQKMSISPDESWIKQQVRLYVFGSDNAIIANNKEYFTDAVLLKRQDYYVNLHWDPQDTSTEDKIATFKLTIK